MSRPVRHRVRAGEASGNGLLHAVKGGRVDEDQNRTGRQPQGCFAGIFARARHLARTKAALSQGTSMSYPAARTPYSVPQIGISRLPWPGPAPSITSSTCGSGNTRAQVHARRRGRRGSGQGEGGEQQPRGGAARLGTKQRGSSLETGRMAGLPASTGGSPRGRVAPAQSPRVTGRDSAFMNLGSMRPRRLLTAHRLPPLGGAGRLLRACGAGEGARP
jgi:hypothetical protein